MKRFTVSIPRELKEKLDNMPDINWPLVAKEGVIEKLEKLIKFEELRTGVSYKMVSITFPLDEKILSEIERFPWINWSEVAREKLNKRRIFEEYIKTGTISDKDEKFCDRIDWFPVDWLELKKEFIDDLKKAKREKSIPMTIDEFRKWSKDL